MADEVEPMLPPPRSGVVRELGEDETHFAFPVMATVHPLADEAWFIKRVDDEQRPSGYRLLGAFEDDQAAVAVAGFRVIRNFSLGDHLYVDDLATLPAARRKGHARSLLEFIAAEASRLQIGEIHMDIPRDDPPARSQWKRGVGNSGPFFPPGRRAAARRLCRRVGFIETADHLALTLGNRPVG